MKRALIIFLLALCLLLCSCAGVPAEEVPPASVPAEPLVETPAPSAPPAPTVPAGPETVPLMLGAPEDTWLWYGKKNQNPTRYDLNAEETDRLCECCTALELTPAEEDPAADRAWTINFRFGEDITALVFDADGHIRFRGEQYVCEDVSALLACAQELYAGRQTLNMSRYRVNELIQSELSQVHKDVGNVHAWYDPWICSQAVEAFLHEDGGLQRGHTHENVFAHVARGTDYSGNYLYWLGLRADTIWDGDTVLVPEENLETSRTSATPPNMQYGIAVNLSLEQDELVRRVSLPADTSALSGFSVDGDAFCLLDTVNNTAFYWGTHLEWGYQTGAGGGTFRAQMKVETEDTFDLSAQGITAITSAADNGHVFVLADDGCIYMADRGGPDAPARVPIHENWNNLEDLVLISDDKLLYVYSPTEDWLYAYDFRLTSGEYVDDLVLSNGTVCRSETNGSAFRMEIIFAIGETTVLDYDTGLIGDWTVEYLGFDGEHHALWLRPAGENGSVLFFDEDGAYAQRRSVPDSALGMCADGGKLWQLRNTGSELQLWTVALKI